MGVALGGWLNPAVGNNRGVGYAIECLMLPQCHFIPCNSVHIGGFDPHTCLRSAPPSQRGREGGSLMWTLLGPEEPCVSMLVDIHGVH